LTWKELADYKHRLYIDRLTHADDIVPIPGVGQLIARLHAKGNLLAVASSTGRNIIEMVLRRFGVRPYFTAVISGAEVIALQAAEQFALYTGVRPTLEQVEEASRVSRA